MLKVELHHLWKGPDVLSSGESRYHLDPKLMPQHVAIIMDGNGRWAKKRFLPRIAGHREGAQRVGEIVEEAGRLGIKALTLYTFSDDNWKRPASEIDSLMNLLNQYLVKEKERLDRNNVRLEYIGDLARLPLENQKVLKETKQALKGNTGLILTLALSYGSRTEIAQACRRVAELYRQDLISLDDITPSLLQAHIHGNEVPELDLLIRTSGEQRLSNFMLWQAAYAELVFSSAYWPQFGPKELRAAIAEFQERDRRFGTVSPVTSSVITHEYPSESSAVCSSKEF